MVIKETNQRDAQFDTVCSFIALKMYVNID